MTLQTKPWFQLITAFFCGAVLGVWQYMPDDPAPLDAHDQKQSLFKSLKKPQLHQAALEDTANIEQLLALKAPDKQASVQQWYEFALSLDNLDLGKRYGNRGQTTPLLSWYALIARNKPEALYKLYNQNKLDKYKFRHLLQFGYLQYWEQYLNKVDQILLSNNQAVLSLALKNGETAARKRVARAFFKLADRFTSSYRKQLDISILRFALKGMLVDELQQVLPILNRGVFKIDPRDIYQLKYAKELNLQNKELLALVNHYSGNSSYSSRMMSRYMIDGAVLGNKEHIAAMIQDAQFNANQPSNFYCAACGLAVASDGLLGMPLINAAKRGKVIIRTLPEGGFVLQRQDRKVARQ